MARWNSTLTDAGINMLANVTDERALQIVRMACGSGSCAAADMRTQTALTNYVMDIPITASRLISKREPNAVVSKFIFMFFLL